MNAKKHNTDQTALLESNTSLGTSPSLSRQGLSEHPGDCPTVSHRGTITAFIKSAYALFGDISPVNMGKIREINQKTDTSSLGQPATYLLPAAQRASEKQEKVLD